MLDTCAVSATMLLLRAVPLPHPVLSQLLASLLPAGGWQMNAASAGGPQEAAQRINLASSIVFSPLMAQVSLH